MLSSISSETFLHNATGVCTRQRTQPRDVPLCTKHPDVTGDSYLFGRAPRGRRNRSRVRHCTGGRTIYYSATMLVPLASDAKDRNQRSAWSRPFQGKPAARPASCQRDKPNLLEPASESALMAADTMNEITTMWGAPYFTVLTV